MNNKKKWEEIKNILSQGKKENLLGSSTVNKRDGSRKPRSKKRKIAKEQNERK